MLRTHDSGSLFLFRFVHSVLTLHCCNFASGGIRDHVTSFFIPLALSAGGEVMAAFCLLPLARLKKHYDYEEEMEKQSLKVTNTDTRDSLLYLDHLHSEL